MPKKTIIIFTTVFAIVGAMVFGLYLLGKKTPTDGTTKVDVPWYQTFYPFGGGGQTEPPVNTSGTTGGQEPGQNGSTPQISRFSQITDFAVAGATFMEDTRLIEINPNTAVEAQPEPIQIVINPLTKEGRKEIQIILNEKLSLVPPLVVDGALGKKAIEAIKAFQKLNNLTITGKIDTETAPFFTKTVQPNGSSLEKSLYEEAPSIRYVERLNGHIYKMFLDTKTKEKISNSTIPSIYEAFFDKTGQTVIYRYLSSEKLINTYLATLSTSNGEFLPQNISDLSISIDKTKFFYLTENSNGVTGTTGTFGESRKDNVFSSPFTEWLSQWDNRQRIYLTTKPSYSVPGSMFILNTTNKTISKIFGGIEGLTTLINKSGSIVLYSVSTTEGPKLGIFDIEKNTTKDLKTFGLPEKCVWSIDNVNIYCAVPNVIKGNQYPDYWYQGLISFDDYFIKINTVDGSVETLANSSDEKSVDGTNLFLDKSENTLFFTNKKDSTLWSLKLN